MLLLLLPRFLHSWVAVDAPHEYKNVRCDYRVNVWDSTVHLFTHFSYCLNRCDYQSLLKLFLSVLLSTARLMKVIRALGPTIQPLTVVGLTGWFALMNCKVASSNVYILSRYYAVRGDNKWANKCPYCGANLQFWERFVKFTLGVMWRLFCLVGGRSARTAWGVNAFVRCDDSACVNMWSLFALQTC